MPVCAGRFSYEVLNVNHHNVIKKKKAELFNKKDPFKCYTGLYVNEKPGCLSCLFMRSDENNIILRINKPR